MPASWRWPSPGGNSQNDPTQSPDPAGATNPQAELDSLLTALFNPTDTGNGAAQCRFPARSQWLINTLGIDRAALPKVDCSDLGAWLNKIQPASVSVIFASEYLDNPASAFAHSFLRFDNPGINNQYYLNFTPKVTDGEPFAKFAYKSSIGGNAGEFTMTNYAKGIADYVQRDGRDVWQKSFISGANGVIVGFCR